MQFMYVFDASSSTGDELLYSWYIGDKVYSNKQSVVYTFDSPGTSMIILEVNNDRGKDRRVKELVITGPDDFTVRDIQ